MAHHSVEKTPTLPGNRRASRTWWPKFWEPYTRNILFACGLVVLPMVAFTMTILWVVFANRLDEARCPYSDLCPDRSHLNSNMSSENYYVAFPAGRLAFISSLSATISFGLVGILMIIFAYSTASELLIDGKDDTGKSSLPSPYQFSLIVRLLNAEVLALCEVIWDNIKMSFARKRKAVCTEREPSTTFRRCILVLTLCLFGR